MTTYDFVPKYRRRRRGLTEQENEILDRIVRAGDDVKQVSRWCEINHLWVKRWMAEGREIP